MTSTLAAQTNHDIDATKIVVPCQQLLKSWLEDMYGHDISACFVLNRWSGFVLEPVLAMVDRDGLCFCCSIPKHLFGDKCVVDDTLIKNTIN